MFDLTVLGTQAKKSARELALMSTTRKNELLALMAQALLDNEENILVANQKDLAQANDNGISTVMQDRLRLTRQLI